MRAKKYSTHSREQTYTNEYTSMGLIKSADYIEMSNTVVSGPMPGLFKVVVAQRLLDQGFLPLGLLTLKIDRATRRFF